MEPLLIILFQTLYDKVDLINMSELCAEVLSGYYFVILSFPAFRILLFLDPFEMDCNIYISWIFWEM